MGKGQGESSMAPGKEASGGGGENGASSGKVLRLAGEETQAGKGTGVVAFFYGPSTQKAEARGSSWV